MTEVKHVDSEDDCAWRANMGRSLKQIVQKTYSDLEQELEHR